MVLGPRDRSMSPYSLSEKNVNLRVSSRTRGVENLAIFLEGFGSLIVWFGLGMCSGGVCMFGWVFFVDCHEGFSKV